MWKFRHSNIWAKRGDICNIDGTQRRIGLGNLNSEITALRRETHFPSVRLDLKSKFSWLRGTVITYSFAVCVNCYHYTTIIPIYQLRRQEDYYLFIIYSFAPDRFVYQPLSGEEALLRRPIRSYSSVWPTQSTIVSYICIVTRFMWTRENKSSPFLSPALKTPKNINWQHFYTVCLWTNVHCIIYVCYDETRVL